MKLYVIGIGPGGLDDMTYRAVKAIDECECIVGYNLYLELIKPLIKDKEQIGTGMMKEVERCTQARDAALSGKSVAVISSGDAGVYGMAGLVLELCENYPQIDVEVIAGITAACSGGAVLGSPITCDYASISLSDLLTPWEVIEKRVKSAAMGDMAMVLYNPASKKRTEHLKKVCEIILEYQSESTVCAVVRNISRDGQSFEITTLGKLKDTPVDMLTTVFIGNSLTKVISGRMVTPRGYKNI